jgi:hypothetical protein
MLASSIAPDVLTRKCSPTEPERAAPEAAQSRSSSDKGWSIGGGEWLFGGEKMTSAFFVKKVPR